MATLENSDMRGVIGGTADADVIHNHGYWATVHGSGGNDTITNGDVDENGKIDNTAWRSFIYGGSGEDSIVNYCSYTYISGGADDDLITSSGYSCTIQGGSGDDAIFGRLADSTIYGGSGDDYIENWDGDDYVIDTGAGDDYVNNADASNTGAKIYLSGGDDSIANAKSNSAIIIGGTGNDVITDGDSQNTTIIAGRGNNLIALDRYQLEGNEVSKNAVIVLSRDPNETVIGSSRILGFDDDDKIFIETSNDGVPYQIKWNTYFYNDNDNAAVIADYDPNGTGEYQHYIGVWLLGYFENREKTTAVCDVLLRQVSLTSHLERTVETLGTYQGGDVTVTSFELFETTTNFETDLVGVDFTDDDFIFKSNTGNYTVQNSGNKKINLVRNGETFLQAYKAIATRTIDKRDSTYANVLVGADNESNIFFAGSGGSSMWGGANSYNALVGGDGIDNFFFGKSGGGDIIENASSNDIVNLYDLSLSDVVSVNVVDNVISASFSSGGMIEVTPTENLSPTFKLTDSTWRYNSETQNWNQV